MAKLSSINKNNRRIKLSDKFYKKREKLKKIIMNKKLSLFVDEITNKIVQNIRPITGYNSFAHNAGLHAASVIKDPTTYESMSPEKYGQIRNILIDKFSGKAAVNYRIKSVRSRLTKPVPFFIMR